MASGSITSSLTESQKGGSWGGCTIDYTLVHASAATAFTNNQIAFASINVQLTIDGKTSSMSMRDWAALFGYDNSLFETIRAWTTYSSVLVVQDLGVKEKRKLSIPFIFTKPVQLTADKEISVTVNNGNGFTNCDSSSQLDIQFFEGFGISAGYPLFTKVVAESGASQKMAQIPANTSKIVVYEHAKSDMLEATQVITSVAINSDKGSVNLQYGELIAVRNSCFPSASIAATRYQNYRVDPYRRTGVELDSGTVTVQYNGSNVSGDQTGVLMESLIVSAGSFIRFAERKEKHAVRAINNLPAAVQQVIRTRTNA